mgnify:CR=1 FL=1
MFKYGSFRLFLIKIILGFTYLVFGIVYFGSLISHNIDDPGFKTFTTYEDVLEIKNYFGLFGSYLSSYSIVLIGIFSYSISLFFLIEGFKNITGIKTYYFFIKFFSNLLSVFLISVVVFFYGMKNINTGLISIFIYDFLNKFLYNSINNIIFINIINIVLLLSGFFLLSYSFSIRLSYLNKFLKIFKFLKYLNVFGFLLKRSTITAETKKTKIKNEPTIKKSIFFNQKEPSISKPKKYKQLEIDQFKFSLPERSFLVKSTNKSSISKEIEKNNIVLAEKLQKTLSEYGVEGKIIGFKTGPIVTLFEFVPNAGIKSSKIIGLSEDIARAMSSISARISSQPGKTSLGIEIPNKKREGVLFGDLIEDERFTFDENALTLALGKDISGEKIFTDLEKMPHLLIAGTTGSGKSVGINTMILSLLYKFKPNECKLILIDPKMLELSIYEDIPHLLTPVVTDPKKSVFALKWVVREMENRYKLMSSVNVKNISSYNNKVLNTISLGRKLYREVQTGIDSDTRIPIIEKKEIKLEKMPFIVVVIDEMADLMMVAGKEVETLVQRLAQMARASGIHLITATQRPSVDVITGTIKANFPSRMSYKVASKFDSRTILNEMGAEQLLGSGDMLFLENGSNIKRLHGGFVSESEVEKVVSSIKKQATFDYKKEISLEDVDVLSKKDDDLISNNNDELYSQAVEIVVKQQKVSTSYIQRYLQIGYNRAARIVEKMEEDGIISEASNAGKRHVLKKE